MNFLLDRFPVDTFLQLSSSLKQRGDKVPLFVLTHQAREKKMTVENGCFYDRDISTGLVTRDVPMVLDRAAFKDASKYEGLAINVFARFSIGQKNFSAQEMSSHYFELYNFWAYKISEHKIDFCFQHYIPHDPSSFILYLVLKNMKVPVVFVDTSHVFNKFRPLACSLEYRDLLLSCGDDECNHKISLASSNYKIKINMNDIEAIPKTVQFRTINANTAFRKRIFNKAIKAYHLIKRESIHRIIKIKMIGLTGHIFKKTRFKWSSKKNDFSKIHFFFFLKFIVLQLYIEKRKYEQKCISSYPKKYVYFAMSAQPEGTTLPPALEFRDVFSVLRLLREAIPEEVPILFKENPSIFEVRNPYLSTVGFRAPDYYEMLLKIPNLKFVSTHSNSHDLIRKSMIVATINGTAALEAVYSGIPAITFGSNWYDKFNGINKFESIDKLKTFYKDIELGKKRNNEVVPGDIKLDINMLIEFEEHNAYEFQSFAQEELVKAFMASIDKFDQLDDRKWSL